MLPSALSLSFNKTDFSLNEIKITLRNWLKECRKQRQESNEYVKILKKKCVHKLVAFQFFMIKHQKCDKESH